MIPVLHQASCVAIGKRGILIEGPPGSGKSSLTLALLDRGAQLVGDDGVALSVKDGALIASPAAEIAGLLEIRNVGLITLPFLSAVAISLILRLDTEAPRFIDKAPRALLLGVPIPCVSLWPDSPVLALRAEWALRTHGLAG